MKIEAKDRRRTSQTGAAAQFFGDRVTIHDFKIGKAIGEGGTAQVYKCTYNNENYAMKIVTKKCVSETALRFMHQLNSHLSLT